ncbi:hypothetical protein MTR67_033904 [Solanum verrucosum]|uniref:Dolichol phosphate-mannose biosynthesis regulatory protein n=1 Tax=Solanum verrucosum TaxID=315347 RepID=A0AAF0ZKU6_SOLVR|nr:hypothetical protein MTR67_033904 [Solanum verrucosum]
MKVDRTIDKYKARLFVKGGTSRGVSMELADRAVGLILTLTSLSIFTYYTFWVIILPLVDSNHFVHKYFLPQEYAILIPVYAVVALICFLSVFIGYAMLKSKKKKAWCGCGKSIVCSIEFMIIDLVLNSPCQRAHSFFCILEFTAIWNLSI